jgi:Peptidoglycan-synthase activator LpoB
MQTTANRLAKSSTRHRALREFLLRSLLAGFVLGSTAVLAPSHSETIVVEAEGNGSSRANAITAALIAAVEQISGLKIEANSTLEQELSSISNGNERTLDLTETQQIEVRRQTGGIVKSYDIISVDNVGDGSMNALLRVSIQRYSAPGLPTQERPRIVVALPANLASADPAQLALMRDAINSYLVQTRRFAVLDRENDTAYRTEIDLLKSADVPLAETVRIGQVIGADYILLSKVRQLQATAQEVPLPITGTKVTRVDAKLSSDFIVIEIASRQVKWSGQVATEVTGDREAVIRAAATEIGEKVVNAIFPLRVIQIVNRGIFVINQGGDTIKVGQIFLANLLGEPTTDPYTKEPLGRTEIPLGTVRISRVDPKLSYGELVSGTLPDGDVEIVLRPTPAQHPPTRPPTKLNEGPRPKW